MNYDFTYCLSVSFDECKTCLRNIKKYSYNTSRNIWILEPTFKDDKCLNYKGK